MKQTKNIAKLEGYNNLLNDIRSILQKSLGKAYKAVDNIKVQTYWQIGERVVREELKYRERASYGRKIITRLSEDLKIDRRLFYRIVKFYRLYPIVVTVSPQLSWSHYEVLINIENGEIRKFYEFQSIQARWSVRELKNRIDSKEFERTKKKSEIVVRFQKQLPAPEDVFKDTYNFDFLELKQDFKEKDLKDALLSRFEAFIKELGSDFFIGRREVPVLIGGNYDKVDLELFHAGLLCYILVEIKIEEFKHCHVSQMYSYLNWYKENKWREGQRLPVGLVICKSKDEETVHYALGDLRKEIFVSEYKIKLPSEKEIINKMKDK